ncbi:MAG: SDR family oxidoreductase [Alphaproteobacteria bacterium]
MAKFKDRLVLVTGAAQGIGAAIAEAFCRQGALVHLADRDGDRLAARAAVLDVPCHTLDLSDRDQVGRLVERLGPVEILINGAGGVAGQTGQPLEAVTEDAWRVIFQANLDGAFWLTQAVAPAMKQAGFGRVVNIASRAGLKPSLTGIQAYTAAKHALVGLTRQLSWELAPHGVTVNAIAPGFILSNPTTVRQWEAFGPEGQQRVIEAIHTKRLGEPEDIAHAALFFADPASGWITGETLSVDGGHS